MSGTSTKRERSRSRSPPRYPPAGRSGHHHRGRGRGYNNNNYRRNPGQGNNRYDSRRDNRRDDRGHGGRYGAGDAPKHDTADIKLGKAGLGLWKPESGSGREIAAHLDRRDGRPGDPQSSSSSSNSRNNRHSDRSFDSRRAKRRRRDDDDGDDSKYTWGNAAKDEPGDDEPEVPIVKEKPSFERSGALMKDKRVGAVDGTARKYAAPVDSAVPVATKWRLYGFHGDDVALTLELKEATYLLGSDTRLAQIPLPPKCALQHAVIQFRNKAEVVTPYIIALDEELGTKINSDAVESARFVELKPNDVLTFDGDDGAEYVLVDTDAAT